MRTSKSITPQIAITLGQNNIGRTTSKIKTANTNIKLA
jgi:hypothetical protein